MTSFDLPQIIQDFKAGVPLEDLLNFHSLTYSDWEYLRGNVAELNLPFDQPENDLKDGLEDAVTEHNTLSHLVEHIQKLEKEIDSLNEIVQFLLEVNNRRGIAINKIAQVIDDINIIENPSLTIKH